MPNINIPLLRSDVEDRLDNQVLMEQIPEKVRQKLTSKKRITRAMNQALVLFVRDADAATIQGLVSNEDLNPDTDVGPLGDGVVGNVKTYLWPQNAFTARGDGGIIKIILDGEERYFDRNSNTSSESVRFQANNSLYGEAHKIFHVDLMGKRIYAPKVVDVSVRIVEEPDTITDDDTYGVGGPEEIPISDAFSQTFSELGVQELLKMAQNYQNRQRVIQDTGNANQANTEEQAQQ